MRSPWEVRGEIPPSAWASAHVLPAALLRTSPLALVSGGPAVWRGSCSGEGLHRLDGQRRCSILVMVGLGRRACHEAAFRAILMCQHFSGHRISLVFSACS